MSGSPDPTRFAARVDRDVVTVVGPDAGSFLQSLVSQDLGPVGVGEAVPALLLQPRGKLLVDFVARRQADDEWWCCCEGGFGSVLAAGLERFRIRVKAEVRVVPSSALAVRGADGAAITAAAAGTGVTAFPVRWGGEPAADLVGAPDALDAVAAALRLPVVDVRAYEAARIEAGVPRLGADLDEDTIPQEAALDRDAVSFTKGCFIGQELVCRIDSRGHVNRLLRRLRGGCPEVGAAVTVAGREVGRVTSAVDDVALAMIRREVEPGSVVEVGGSESRVEAC